MSRLVDLSHTIEDGMVTYPGLPEPAIGNYLTRENSRSRYAQGTEFHIGEIAMVANTGTYIDTPFHRFSDGYDVAHLPLEQVADLPGVCVESAGPSIGRRAFDELNVAGKAVLIATGWSRHWRTDRYGSGNHPHLTSAAAVALADQGVALVGIDSVNIDGTGGKDRPVHTVLLAAGIPILEHLTGLDALIGTPFQFFAVPAKVAGLGSFPTRAFAIVE